MLQLLAGRSTSSHSPARHPVRCLVLVPTRELAAQVEESIRTYGKHMRTRTAVIYGGVGFGPQAGELRRGVDIVVATPGRLLDHVEQRTIDLRQIEILVLDEADRMLDMGFIHDIRKILKLLPAKRQNLLFSATFPEEVRTLAAGFMHDAVTVEIAQRNMPIELIVAGRAPGRQGPQAPAARAPGKDRATGSRCWCSAAPSTARTASPSSSRPTASRPPSIHGNKSQPQRMKALKRFKDCELQVLVATDIAARGIDIESLPHVVNYDLPHVSEDYVHRIGRTGRAGESGQAVSLVSGEDRTLLRDIERLIGKQIEQQVIPGFEPGAGYRHAQPEPQQRRGQRPHSQPRRPDKSRSAQRSQGNGQHRNESPRRGGQPSAQPRKGNGQRRDRGDRQGFRSANALPSEQRQQSVQQQQLDYHHKQMAEEGHRVEKPADEQGKEGRVAALFGWVGRKVA